MTTRHPQWAAGQHGFSMIEVMIALVVLTIGVLGMAAMQEFAVTRSLDANELSIATNLAAEMIERITYNAKNVASYNGISVSSASTSCPATPVMTNGDCTQWRNRLVATRLPSPSGTVSVTTTGPASLNQWLVTVRIRWQGLVVPLTFSTVVSI
jgi:type IV pilus assembly protein PilV